MFPIPSPPAPGDHHSLLVPCVPTVLDPHLSELTVLSSCVLFHSVLSCRSIHAEINVLEKHAWISVFVLKTVLWLCGSVLRECEDYVAHLLIEGHAWKLRPTGLVCNPVPPQGLGDFDFLSQMEARKAHGSLNAEVAVSPCCDVAFLK